MEILELKIAYNPNGLSELEYISWFVNNNKWFPEDSEVERRFTYFYCVWWCEFEMILTGRVNEEDLIRNWLSRYHLEGESDDILFT